MDEKELRKIISEVLRENYRVMYIPDLAPYLIEKLDKAGYHKIQEGDVVLSKEEYEGLKKRVHALEHLATCYSEQIDWDNDTRKKTAKEIFDEVMELARNYYPSIDHYCISEKAISLQKIKKLMEKYCVEVEE